MEELIGSIRLGVGHSLIIGNVPPIVAPKNLSKLLSENSSAEVESFGFWESSSPNYATYYPDATAEDLNPKDEEFITPMFRLLSEVIVFKGIPIDFGKPNVLKNSMSKLLGQTVNIDHETMVGNAIGSVSSVTWQKAYETKSGKTVPAGINGVLKIDGKSNPRIARGIMMKPPSIHSNSVTVRYKWKPSHEFEDNSEFYRKVGTYDEEGELIRCVVSEVLSYSETSLVSHGADPYAQKIEDGEIVNPEYAANIASFSADKAIQGFVFYDTKEYEGDFRLDATIPKQQNNNNNINITTKMDELIKSFQEEFGFKEGDLTKDNLVQQLKDHFSANKLEAEKVANLETQISGLETEKSDLSTKLSDLQEKYDTLDSTSADAKAALKLTQDEAVRLYKTVKGEKADDNIIGLIGNGDFKTAASFVKQYREEAEASFAATCNDCNSTNITRASAKTSKEGLITDEDEDDDNKETGKMKSNMEVIKSFKSKNSKRSRIFGEKKEDK